MKPTRHLILFAAIFALSCAVKSPAEIIFKETFDYPEGSKLADCTNAGTPWIVDTNVTSATITKAGLKFGDGTANPSATPSVRLQGTKHAVPKYSGDIVYVKFTFTAGPGTTLNPDCFGFILHSYKPGSLLIGTGLTGNGAEKASNNISVRVLDTNADRITSQTLLTDNTPCVVIAEWSKSTSGPKSPYDRLRMWVNTDGAKIKQDKTSAQALPYPKVRESFSQVAFYLADTEPGDVYIVRNVVVATTLDEVLAP